MFQHPNHQLLASTVREELELGPRNLGLDDGEVARRAADAAARFGLAGELDLHPFRLGLPARRRLAIAAVLAVRAPVVVLDEPTAGLDEAERDALATVVREEATRGAAVIVVTHDLRFAGAVAGRLLVLRDGRVAAEGTLERLVADAERLVAAGLEPPPLVRLAAALGLDPALAVRRSRRGPRGSRRRDGRRGMAGDDEHGRRRTRPAGSWLHRMSAIPKLAWAAAGVATALVTFNPVPLLAISIAAVLVAATAGEAGRLLRAMLPFAPLAASILLVQVLAPLACRPACTVATTVGPFTLYAEGLTNGLSFVARLLTIELVAFTAILATRAPDLLAGLVRIGVPSSAAFAWRPPSSSSRSCGASSGSSSTRSASAASGSPVRPRSPASLVPVIVASVERAQQLAISLESRGFGSGVARTSYREASLGRGDVAAGGRRPRRGDRRRRGGARMVGSRLVRLAATAGMGRRRRAARGGCRVRLGGRPRGRVRPPRLRASTPGPIRQTAGVRPSTGTVLDPADPGFAADPYPAYAIARDAAAAFQQPGDHRTYLTRYEDVHAGFRDRRLGSTFLHRYTPEELSLPPDVPAWRDPRWTDFQAFERWELLNLEPPVHTRLRRLVLEAFTPRAVEALRTPDRGARADAARTRPGARLGRPRRGLRPGLLAGDRVRPDRRRAGRPGHDQAPLGRHRRDVRAGRRRGDPVPRERGRGRLPALPARRHRPAAGHAAATTCSPRLLEATVDGERLTDEQVASTAMVLLMAGHEATVNATANGVAALAAHPDQWQALRAGRGIGPRRDRGDPALRPAAPVVRALGARRGRRPGRRPARAGLARRARDRCRQPRSAAVHRAGPVRHPARRRGAPLVRRRDPLLHRRAARAAGARDDAHASCCAPRRRSRSCPARPAARRSSSAAGRTCRSRSTREPPSPSRGDPGCLIPRRPSSSSAAR